uniref:Uncharacterized protein n=1 Tax=Catagonus wagneri TaxID=51154 RepID=A0A8C3X7W1_9CETA
MYMSTTLFKMFGSSVKPYCIQVYQEIWVGMESSGFIIYKIKSVEKRSKVLKASSPGPSHSHQQPAIVEVYVRGNISL